MYIHQITIRNIRSIKTLDISFAEVPYAGWHVFLGDNGAGKSTLIRSIALGLTGPSEAAALRQNWSDWLQLKKNAGRIRLQIEQDPKLDKATGKGSQITRSYLSASLLFGRNESSGSVSMEAGRGAQAKRYWWGEGRGWFCASYGPFRRFSGGDNSHTKLFYSHPHLAPHLSAFGEEIALTECIGWLQSLHVKRLEGSESDGQLLESLKKFLNEGGLLPHGAQLHDVSSEGVVFKDGNGNPVNVTLLSDGFRSILSMTFELIRQMTLVYKTEKVFEVEPSSGNLVVGMPGVVLIDEIDAHLHPTWQLRVGYWFRKYFPKVQFIVTTHSPLVCHAAETGSIWKLPTPGSSESMKRVIGGDLRKLLYGDLVEAYDTELFGVASTRSDSSKELQTRLATLNVKARRSTLSSAETKELKKLRAMLPTVATATDAE